MDIENRFNSYKPRSVFEVGFFSLLLQVAGTVSRILANYVNNFDNIKKKLFRFKHFL